MRFNRTRGLVLRAVLVAAAVALTISACGGSSSDDTGSAASPAGAPDSETAVEFSECMRENGVPEFPDPEEGRFKIIGKPGGGGLDPSSPQFQEAQEACQQYAPQMSKGGAPSEEMKEGILEMAECMRENGIPDFPDPDFSGGGFQLKLPQGVDPESPQFKEAQEACGDIIEGIRGDR